MALMDAVIRLLPGALNDSASAVEDSFVNGLLDSPHYTRPEVYEGAPVPPSSGRHHAEIEKWRRQRTGSTASKRPDLIVRAREQGLLSKADEKFLGAPPQHASRCRILQCRQQDLQACLAVTFETPSSTGLYNRPRAMRRQDGYRSKKWI
jgi:hypothetical protein